MKDYCQKFLNSPYSKIGLVVLTVATGFLYVLQMNISATKGYDIRELEQRIALLQKDNRDLELDAMELQSLERVIGQLSDYYLVEATPDNFISTTTTTFASR